jgi:hypothetical protein
MVIFPAPSSADTYIRTVNGVMENFEAIGVEGLPHSVDQRFKSKDS